MRLLREKDAVTKVVVRNNIIVDFLLFLMPFVLDNAFCVI